MLGVCRCAICVPLREYESNCLAEPRYMQAGCRLLQITQTMTVESKCLY